MYDIFKSVSMTSSNTTFGGITGYINTNYVTIDIIQNCYYLNTSSAKAVGNISTIDKLLVKPVMK